MEMEHHLIYGVTSCRNKDMIKQKEKINYLRFLFSVENKLHKNPPEQCLFIAVILQALLDASRPRVKEESDDRIEDRDKARAWFFASVGVTCEDFMTVCDHAGVDFSTTRAFTRNLLQSQHQSRIRNRINILLRKDIPLKTT